MSAALFSLNADLKRLRDEGYRVHVEGGNLVMREIPYLDAAGNTKLATIMSSLCLAGNITQKPEPHTVTYEGEFPCDVNGNQMALLAAGAAPGPQGTGVVAQYQLSRKPGPEGYIDYYQKKTASSTMSNPRLTGQGSATSQLCSWPSASQSLAWEAQAPTYWIRLPRPRFARSASSTQTSSCVTTPSGRQGPPQWSNFERCRRRWNTLPVSIQECTAASCLILWSLMPAISSCSKA